MATSCAKARSARSVSAFRSASCRARSAASSDCLTRARAPSIVDWLYVPALESVLGRCAQYLHRLDGPGEFLINGCWACLSHRGAQRHRRSQRFLAMGIETETGRHHCEDGRKKRSHESASAKSAPAAKAESAVQFFSHPEPFVPAFAVVTCSAHAPASPFAVGRFHCERTCCFSWLARCCPHSPSVRCSRFG